ncbi:ATP-binding protein [Fictibacillus terranigra]|uniref:ATP-binding protein n=1 Tax=Fictibacillus terranigra TaxID=3058424 RepID=UPI003CD0CDEF
MCGFILRHRLFPSNDHNGIALNGRIITTNLQFGQWNHVFGDPILTEAVLA